MHVDAGLDLARVGPKLEHALKDAALPEFPMFIQTETTPNPASLKFLPGRTVMETGTASFTDAADAAASPLAARLFGIDGVVGVFLGAEFISVSKNEASDWYQLKPSVLGAIMEHYTSGQPVFIPAAGEAKVSGDEEDGEIVGQIKELIETRVRPAVAQDGGDIVFHRFEDGVVFLEMHGSCSGCPSSTATLKAGIENMLRHYVPEVLEVRAV
jgi:Fe-S cluster biogenesis protein NfuA